MRLVPLLIGTLLVTGCGAAMSEKQAAAELDTARISVSWGDDPVVHTFDLRNGVGTTDGGVILTADAAYEPIQTPIAAAPEKRWLKWSREPWDPFLMAPIAGRPDELLAFLGSAERGEAVGEGEERGEPVEYYTATVQMEKFIATQPPGRRADLEEVFADWEGIVFHLAVDSEGRFRRAEFAFADQEVLVVEIFDYGVPVQVQAPDSSTVLTSEEYDKLLQAECERLKKEGRENEAPHCVGGCSAGEGEGAV
jgi:hypothetical protein